LASVCAAAEVMLARPNFTDRVQGLRVVGQVDPLGQHGHHAELVGVQDKLLVAEREAAFEPAGGVEHEVDPGKHGRQQRARTFVGSLRIGRFSMP
jgi:hypothetical protein